MIPTIRLLSPLTWTPHRAVGETLLVCVHHPGRSLWVFLYFQVVCTWWHGPAWGRRDEGDLCLLCTEQGEDRGNGKRSIREWRAKDLLAWRYRSGRIFRFCLFPLRCKLSSHSALLHTVTRRAPQLSHVHPHFANDHDLLCENVRVCTHTPAHAGIASLPARFLPPRSQHHSGPLMM